MKGAALIALLAVLAAFVPLGLHKVDEGNVGVYWRGGALLNRVTYPGWHLKFPFVDAFENVQITMQTDKVTEIPCGTSGGVMLWIERVEVVNRLREQYVYDTIKNYTTNYDKIWIFDKIHHEINQFCSKHTLHEVYIELFHTVDDRLQAALQESCDKWAPGIEIIAIRITKPKIPPQILKNFEAMEAEKTRLLVAVEQQKVVEREAETEKRRAAIEAEKLALVSKIQMEQYIMEKESQRKMKEIDDTGLLHHEQTVADAEYYRTKKAAEANALLHTPEYLKVEMMRSIGNTTKIYFGPSLHNLIFDFMETLTKDAIAKKP